MSRILSRLGLIVASLALVFTMAPQAGAQAGVDADGDGAADVSIDRDPIGDGIHFAGVDAQPNANGDTGAGNVGGTGGAVGLAYTGAETEAVMAVSLGLLALGGSVLVTSRRRLSAHS